MKRKIKSNVVVFFVIMLTLPTLTLLLPKKAFSENENRYLQEFTLPTLKTLKDKTYMEDLEKALSDHFVLREQWIKSKNMLDIATNKKEIKGVYLTKKRLIEHQTYQKSNTQWVSNIDAITAFVSKYQKPSSLMVVPTAESIYSDELPANAPFVNQKAVIDQIYKRAGETAAGLSCVDVYTPLLSAKNDNIYYKTDHHWTSRGAYLGYFSSAKSLLFSPVDLGQFNIEHASHDFWGTLYSKTLYAPCGPDVIDLYHLTTSDPETTVTVKSGSKTTQYDSIFFRDYLDKKDKYATYLGQNEPCVTIKNKASKGPKLLIVKDSFAHSMVQFYIHHYSEITMIDPRYFSKLEQYVDMANFDQVLFVYGFTSMTTDANISKLAHF